MRYLSVCSGIEAATVAWHPLGWTPAAFSEIEAFPRAVLAHHYPDVPLHGDFTTIGADDYGSVDLLVGGTPCQDFSVAGLRAGIAGDRGNLTLEFLRLAARTQPRWIVWENVPGVLSSDEGRALGAFLGGLAELGYGFAYRVLDAQYFGLAQRRARVFVVGYLGDWRRAAAVLFERESLLGHPAPRREAGERTAAGTAQRPSGGGDSGLIPEVCRTLVANGNKTGGIRPPGTDGDTVTSLIVMASGQSNAPVFENDQCPALTCLHEAPIIAHTLRGNGFDASEDGTGRGTPLAPVSFLSNASFAEHGEDICGTPRTENLHAVAFSIMPMNSGKDYKARETDIAQPIMAGGPVGGNQGGDFIVEPVAYAIQAGAIKENPDHGPDGVGVRGDGAAYTLEARAEVQAVAFDLRGREGGAQFEGPHDTANIRAASGGSSRSYVAAMQVRRLTPRECERLQGFPDHYTLVPYRNKPAADGVRYKALGNSMAVPVMAWIGQRIAMIETLIAA